MSCGFFCFVLFFIPERKPNIFFPSSQLLVPRLLPFLVLVDFKFELAGRDHAVFVAVLVLKHVGDDLLHCHSRLCPAFSFCNLELDKLRELKDKEAK